MELMMGSSIPKRLRSILLLSLAGLSPVAAIATDPAPSSALQAIPQIVIVRKSGQEDGVAEIKVKDKVHKITPHAVQAWPVRGGQGALILVVEKKGSSPKQYMLRYYDLDSGRRRVLGAVSFNAAEIHETSAATEQWAFALSGKDLSTRQPLTIVGDEEAIPGVIPGAASPSFTANTFTYTLMPGGEKRIVKTASLLVTDLHDIYTPPQNTIVSLQYLQVFPNGTAMTVSQDGVIHQGRWQTNGETISLTIDTAKLSIPQASLQSVNEVPAGTRFSARLLQPLSSLATKATPSPLVTTCASTPQKKSGTAPSLLPPPPRKISASPFPASREPSSTLSTSTSTTSAPRSSITSSTPGASIAST
jgi:hypothetical protein